MTAPCTTWLRRERHVSGDLTPEPSRSRNAGKSGPTLCGDWAYDQTAMETRLAKKLGPITDLPACTVCERLDHAADAVALANRTNIKLLADQSDYLAATAELADGGESERAS